MEVGELCLMIINSLTVDSPIPFTPAEFASGDVVEVMVNVLICLSIVSQRNRKTRICCTFGTKRYFIQSTES